MLTHKFDHRIEKNIHKIFHEKGPRDFYVLSHGSPGSDKLRVPVHSFSLDQIKSLNFKMLEKGIVPGSGHLPLIKFYREFSQYEYYWLIEYDVEFGGNWESFLKTYENCNADFISSYIKHYQEEKGWPWWDMQHPRKEIDLPDRVRSFNSIYRISNKALQFLDEELSTGWLGHYEVLLSTILYQNNFKLLDFGGRGKFSSSLYPNFYTESYRLFRFLKLGTMRYRPAMKKAGYRKLLYHPVKSETGLSKIEEVNYMLRSFKKGLKKILAPASLVPSRKKKS